MATAASGDERLLLLPPQLQELTIRGFQERSLYCSNSVDGGETAAIELQGLPSLQTLSIFHCPKLLCSSLQTSLQRLQLWFVEGMATLPPPPLLNLTNLEISRCGNLRGGQVLHALLVQGHLTNLQVIKTPNFFLGSERWVDEQDDVRHCSKLQVLRTDDFAGVLATTICRLIASSLTVLALQHNDDVECFTKEQDEALQILTSIQDLEIFCCNKLLFLPAGLNQLPNLEVLRICGCRAISSLGSLPDSLQTLRISVCPAIHSLPKDGLPGSLREINVRDCENEELYRQCHKIKGTIPVGQFCRLLSSSLTTLVLAWNDEVECFTRGCPSDSHLHSGAKNLVLQHSLLGSINSWIHCED
ncbi:hypothetical protein E2562_034413 [Oryza meyeriana var. granulata]|uniref:Uncharacterized protein n=1 Tax=Oryza meyeriana var. granulata TaxID=110450 RepID=A0A6G1BQA5_9ORYZ|nr:hypothetical protein E2562_034413 [Oryza meyeriana var. granulata]